MEKHIGYVCMKSFFKNIRPISWRGLFADAETSDPPKLSPWRELHLKSACYVNLLSKLSIIFKEWRVIVLFVL